MFERSILPVLLAGLLTVGCSTAQAQERADAPEPVESREPSESGGRDAGLRERAIQELRAALARSHVAMRLREVEVDARRNEIQLRKAALQSLHRQMNKKQAALTDESAKLQEKLDAARRKGLGDEHSDVTALLEKLQKIERMRAEIDVKLQRSRTEMRGYMPAIQQAQMKLADARRRVAELQAQLDNSAVGAPLPAAQGEFFPGGPGGRGPHMGRGPGGPAGPGMRGGPGSPFGGARRGPPRGGEHGVEDRVARLERTVTELRTMLERHGFPENRRQRAMGEMERRRREHMGPPPGRGRPAGPMGPRTGGPRGPGTQGRSGMQRGPGGGRGPGGPGMRGGPGGPSMGGEQRRPPPDTGAMRAEAEEIRRQLDRTRRENAELRTEMDSMARKMAEMRESFEMELRRRAKEAK